VCCTWQSSSLAGTDKGTISKAKIFEGSNEEIKHKECLIQKKVTKKCMAVFSQNILM
jgi:hypothetical protein